MRGLTDEEIKSHRQNAIEFLQRKYPDCEIIDSFFEGESTPDNPLELLGKSIQMLNGVNAIYMLNGWQNARGCIIEHECAMRYGIHIIYEDIDYAITKCDTLEDTITPMIGADFKNRFIAEYWQTKIRYNNLHKTIIKMEAGTIDFTPNCSKELLSEQANIMGRYLYLLEIRAEIEGINLGL